MLLPTKSNLDGYQYSGGIYGNTKNNITALNIKRNDQSNNDDKLTQLNGTEANLNLNDVYYNKIVNKSVMQEKNQNQIYCEKINNIQYPISDNFRNQLYLNDKYLNPINNLNNNAINEINIEHNNKIQQNLENTNFNGIIDINNNSFPNINMQKKINYKKKCKCNCNKKCCTKCAKISGYIFLILLNILLFLFCLFFMVLGSKNHSLAPSDKRGNSSKSGEFFSCCCPIKGIINKIKEIYNS